jgi:hypothetical protein
MLAVLKDVRALIERLAPEPVCDDCITERLGLTGSQNAEERTQELAGERGFERSVEPCAICATTRKVTRRKVK